MTHSGAALATEETEFAFRHAYDWAVGQRVEFPELDDAERFAAWVVQTFYEHINAQEDFGFYADLIPLYRKGSLT